MTEDFGSLTKLTVNYSYSKNVENKFIPLGLLYVKNFIYIFILLLPVLKIIYLNIF